MEHVYCQIPPKAIRFISFYSAEKCTRSGAKMTWENRFDSNGQKKKHSRNRAARGILLMPFGTGRFKRTSQWGGPGRLESDKDLLLPRLFFRRLVSSPKFCLCSDGRLLIYDYLCSLWAPDWDGCGREQRAEWEQRDKEMGGQNREGGEVS